jgi:uncharacterized membrane protein YeaQ/YmgE (transglycosylase-associated protein family)
MSPGIVALWIVIGVAAAVIGRLVGSYDKPSPWGVVLSVAIAGAVVGGLIGLAIMDENVSATMAGAVIGAGVATALRSVVMRREQGHRV